MEEFSSASTVVCATQTQLTGRWLRVVQMLQDRRTMVKIVVCHRVSLWVYITHLIPIFFGKLANQFLSPVAFCKIQIFNKHFVFITKHHFDVFAKFSQIHHICIHWDVCILRLLPRHAVSSRQPDVVLLSTVIFCDHCQCCRQWQNNEQWTVGTPLAHMCICHKLQCMSRYANCHPNIQPSVYRYFVV